MLKAREMMGCWMKRVGEAAVVREVRGRRVAGEKNWRRIEPTILKTSAEGVGG